MADCNLDFTEKLNVFCCLYDVMTPVRDVTCVKDLTSSILLALVVTDLSLSLSTRGRRTDLLLSSLGTVQSQVTVETLRRGPGAGSTEGWREAGAESWPTSRRSNILNSAAS